MKVSILSLSEKQPAWVDAAIASYHARLPRDWATQLVTLRPEKRTASTPTDKILALEADKITAAIAKGTRLLVLDERGSAWTTRELAQQLQVWQDEAQPLAFVIGSADGLAPSIKASAHQCFQLSRMTLPHGMARILLLEQLYRASSILAGHPYHRD